MAEEVVEDVGLDQIVQLVLLPDPTGHREAPIGEMIEEYFVRNEAGYRDDAPSGRLAQNSAGLFEIGDAARTVQPLQPVEKGACRVFPGEPDLPLVKTTPAVMLRVGIGTVILRHGVILCRMRIVAAQFVRAIGRSGFLHICIIPHEPNGFRSKIRRKKPAFGGIDQDFAL